MPSRNVVALSVRSTDLLRLPVLSRIEVNIHLPLASKVGGGDRSRRQTADPFSLTLSEGLAFCARDEGRGPPPDPCGRVASRERSAMRTDSVLTVAIILGAIGCGSGSGGADGGDAGLIADA